MPAKVKPATGRFAASPGRRRAMIRAPRRSVSWPGVPLALTAALLFGASAPFAKALLGSGINPWLLAGLLYLASGLGLAVLRLARQTLGTAPAEAPLARFDLPSLGLIVLFGGIAGPVLLMLGLNATPAATAALLLNLEGPATMAIAWLAYRENVDRRLLAGAAAILAGTALLSWRGGPKEAGWGALAIAGACLAWGIDNNLTRRLSAADPVDLALLKGLAAGGAVLPGLGGLAGAAAVGFLGYGLSLVLFVLALRHLGAARTGAYFSTAPFIGAVLAVPLFGEPVTARLAAGGALMALGVALHLTEAHEHEHRHEAVAHAHRHAHDLHHCHAHGPDDPPGEPHAHRHRHLPLVHRHPHYPDLHHRHRHPPGGAA